MTNPTVEVDGAETPPAVAANADDESQYPRGFKLLLVTIALLSSMFLVSLDGTILATAIPNITDHFHSLNDVGWYGGSYLFAVGALQLLYGKLYTIYRVKSVFLVAVALFELGSLVAGVAPTSDAPIIGRTISGTGAAGILAGSIIIIGRSVPLRQRPIFTSILSAVHGISSVIGPILGGVFTDHVTWRLCFLINLPFGVITIFFLLFCLPQQPPTQLALPWNEQIKQFDLPGTFCIVPSIISLLLALQWGGSMYPFNDGRIIALFVLAGVLAIAFAGVEVWQGDNATLPGRIMKNKNILGGVWFGVFISGAILIFTYYLPIWFQAIQGVSATQSGIRTLPAVLGLVLFSIIGGGAATALGQYVPLLLISSIVASVGAGLLSTLKVDSTIGYWFGYQALMAAGVGLGAQNVMLVGQVAVPHVDMAMAISVMSFSQTLSSSIFLAVAQAVFQNSLESTLRAHTPEVDPGDVINGGVTAIRRLVTAEQLPSVLRAYNSAIMQTIYIAVAASGLSIAGALIMDWLSLKKKTETEKKESLSPTTD
ncbi:MFS general substrate transporter [Xylaria sp. FL0043]|nr:MFS general substrate transporter [Xylaria sp. FL0043]